jgi:hypothetical protein
MGSQKLSEEAQAQAAVRAEIEGFLADTRGENAPVEIIIAFSCPDGQFGFCATNYGGALRQIGMLEAVKKAILGSMPINRASSGVN